MIIRSPLDRYDLNIKKKDKVLEVGSGHNPTFRSNTIVEKYVDTNYHRCGDVKIYPHQTFVNAPGEILPFKDKEFDYVICNQVLEHVDDPVLFVREQCRVAKRGYLETPSLLGEFLFPKKSHKWVILYINNKLVLFEKDKMPGNYGNNYGELFLNYLPYQSLIYKLLWFTEGDLMLNRCEWADDIDIIVNPTDEKYLSFFTGPWNRGMVQQLYPQRSLAKEIIKSIKALMYLVKSKIKDKKHTALDLNEYLKLHSK
ncbi:class I SAM-dependent methyltransferase [Bacteroides sp.]|uniref:class I SAM-dependent methyltransferase n=1 Tax=Bacteroides sp. TaxID=29523 RepID=UPI002638ED38|nr:class I SAM-dependent methyltransferase [Bacteroides sp.]MDD3037765.1 class I SAM-dependent methyltransferase [Bacteroides sp.]